MLLIEYLFIISSVVFINILCSGSIPILFFGSKYDNNRIICFFNFWPNVQATARGEEGMTLFFVCCNPNCGHRWRD